MTKELGDKAYALRVILASSLTKLCIMLMLQAPHATPTTAQPRMDNAGAHRVSNLTAVDVFVATNRSYDPKEAKTEDRFKGDLANVRYGVARVVQPGDDNIAPTDLVKRGFSFPQLRMGYRSREWQIAQVGTLSEPDFFRQASARARSSSHFPKRLFLFVHGYNNNFASSVTIAAKAALAYQYDGATAVFSWPSAGAFQAYFTDRDNARRSGVGLFEFLRRLNREGAISQVYLIAHSMGNLVVVEALKLAAADQSFVSSSKIAHVMMCAPDLDRSAFRQEFRSFKETARGFTLYATSNDVVLKASEMLQAAPRLGFFDVADIPFVDGLDIIDASRGSMELIAGQHFKYAFVELGLGEDFRRLLLGSIAAPDARLFAHQRTESPKGTYWVYTPPH